MGAYYGRKMIVVMMIKDDTIRDGPWSLRKQVNYNVEDIAWASWIILSTRVSLILLMIMTAILNLPCY